MPLKDAFFCHDLEKVRHARITKILRDKFRASTYDPGITISGKKERALRLTKQDLKSKSIEYNVPDEIIIGPPPEMPSGPDNFDKIILGIDRTEDETEVSSTVRTVRTVGTLRTVPEGGDGSTSNEIHAQIASDIEREYGITGSENSPTYHLKASGASGASGVSKPVQEVERPSSMKPFGFTEPIHGKSLDLEARKAEAVQEQDRYVINDAPITDISSESVKQSDNISPGSVPTVPTVPKPNDVAGGQSLTHDKKSLTSPNEAIPDKPSTQEPMLRNLPEMSEKPEEEDFVVSEKELEDLQEPSKEIIGPITSFEGFFNDDIPLEPHSFEESPCYPIIGSRPGEISTDTVYYCKIHPDRLGTTFLTAIENHCRDEPDIHKAEILRLGGTATAERDTTQRQHGDESA
jgi:hypothetical protein